MELPSGLPARRTGLARAPQDVAAGILLLALAGLAIWLVDDLAQGTLRAIGPALLPRALAAAVGVCGVALLVVGLRGRGAALTGVGLRGPFFVLLGILAFAFTIRPVQVGALMTPGLGLGVAGPLAIVIGGFASPEARFRELLILALSLTPFCMILFGDLLNLPIPLFPQALADQLPESWSQRDALRATAAALAMVASGVWLLGRKRGG